ncbi:MAG: hypothetical protein E7148_06590 [Rikenellaceae bacterium]|nr:hypothetical protein [Rikenellaceae bacterium]
MNPNPNKNYLGRGWVAVSMLIAVLVAVSFIPPQSVGEVKFRRANILADLITFEDKTAMETPSEPMLFDEEEFRVDMQAVAEQIIADTLPRSVQTCFEWHYADMLPIPSIQQPITPDTARMIPTLTPIEDFSDNNSIQAFCDTLLLGHRPIRIAFLGDSFVEGDILTADLRERLQTTYGGGGAGFAPMDSPLTGFRRSIKTQSKGWTSYNIMQHKNTPEPLKTNYYVSGWVCQPTPEASTRWETTKFRKGLDSCTTARLLFIATQESRVKVTLNDTLRREFNIEKGDVVRQIAVHAPQIHSVELCVLSGAEGFIGYGVIMEGGRITVDNYSIRSNNGQAMFRTNPAINAQIHTMTPYDLVILQYGLNIMQTGVTNYSGYANQIEKMIGFVRQCFPQAAVLVMGVSDRSVKTENGFEPMDAIPAMLDHQRQAARRAKAAFWPTCDAMRVQGGMARFVQKGWAGKDFTHINYAGGRQIAWALFDAFQTEINNSYQRQELKKRQSRQQAALIDSLQQNKIYHDLLSGTTPEIGDVSPQP